MSKKTTVWLIIATFLVFLGSVMFAAAIAESNWDFSELGTVKYESNTYQIEQEFHSVSLKASTADIVFMPAEDGVCKVICYEEEKLKHAVSVQDGTLVIHRVDEREWYDHIGISIGTSKVTVYLPDIEYDTISVSVSTGKTHITHLQCKNLITRGSTGDVFLQNVVASENISIERSTGDIEFERCDGAELFVKTGTGDVEGSLLSDKVFFAESDTGSIDVPKTTVGGTCEISTDTGDIHMEILAL